MVAGVIVMAVAIKFTIEAPTEAGSAVTAASTLCAPIIYLAGLVLFKHSVSRGQIRPPLIGVAVLVLIAPLASLVSRLALAAAATAVLAAPAVATGRTARVEPLR
jgi:low temperature requirement protein LtrA